MAARSSRVTVCPECDWVVQLPRSPSERRLRCPRCRALLWRGERDPRALLPWIATAWLLWFASGIEPLAQLELLGRTTEVTLWTLAAALAAAHEGGLAAVVAVTTVVAPVTLLATYTWLLLPLWRRRPVPGIRTLLRYAHWHRHWAMLDVFLLGVVVAAVKLGGMARLLPRGSLLAFVAFTVILAVIHWRFDWERFREEWLQCVRAE
ncbi:paraquat-inducible protein A [Hydrogenophilus islandicus]